MSYLIAAWAWLVGVMPAWASDGQMGGPLGWITSLMLALGGFAMLRSVIKRWVASHVADAIRLALEAGDSDDDEVVLAVARWMRKKAQKLDGQGREAHVALARVVCARIKLLRGREADVADLLEDVLQAAIQAEQRAEAGAAPPAPAVPDPYVPPKQ